MAPAPSSLNWLINNSHIIQTEEEEKLIDDNATKDEVPSSVSTTSTPRNNGTTKNILSAIETPILSVKMNNVIGRNRINSLPGDSSVKPGRSSKAPDDYGGPEDCNKSKEDVIEALKREYDKYSQSSRKIELKIDNFKITTRETRYWAP